MNPAKRLVPALVAIALAALAWIPWNPSPSEATTALASAGIKFEKHALPNAPTNQRMRPVAPALAHIQPWISAVGASTGAFDLRGLGRPADACLTDPRDDKLRIFPIPGAGGASYPAFELEPGGLRYDKTMAPIGCVPTDIDADGRPEIIAYYWGRSPVIYRNHAPGTGTPQASWFRPEELVTPMQVWNSTALNVADIDGDGNLDIAVGNYFPDGARVLDPTAADDPRMQMQHSMGDAHNAGINRIFLGTANNGTQPLRFSDVSERWPQNSASAWTLALGFQDLSGNGSPDLYVANDFGPDQLLVNTSLPGNVRFTEVRGERNLTTARSKVLGHDSFKGMGVAYSYEENADLPRIFISNITTTWGLQEANLAHYPTGAGRELLRGRFPYQERAAEVGIARSGWSWDIKPIDVQNSGQESLLQATGMIRGEKLLWAKLQEMAMGNDQILSSPTSWMRIEEDGDISGHEPNRLWKTYGEGFVDVGAAVPFTPDTVSRGLAVGDFNGDGRQDFLVANQWGPSQAYINRSESQRPSMTLQVLRDGTHGPTPLIGAKVTVTGPGYKRVAQLYPANGHSGVSGSDLHFAVPTTALPGATAFVQWREDGKSKTQRFSLSQGAQKLRVDR